MQRKRQKLFRYGIAGICAIATLTIFMSAESPDFKLGRNVQILYNMFRELNMFYVDPIDADKMLKDAGDGMVSNLDPYTELIPESEMSDFEFMTTGKYGGIGSLIQKKGDYVIIAQPYKGFPADKAGLKIGDMILSVNGKNIKGYETTKVSNMMKGEPGTTLKLTVRKLLSGQEETVTIKRERIALPSVPYYGVVGDSIGYILLETFTENCSEDVRNAFMNLKNRGIKSLVIDLRNNGGGILQEAVKIVSLFVPRGTEVVSMRGRNKDLDATFRTQNDPIDTQIPIAILVNNLSASASEIVAGSLQDLDRAVLVGQRTFGKGLVQSTRPLGYNSYLKVTTAKYYTPSGRCIQAVDYTHRQKDGKVSNVPDSLFKEFKTKGGRKVYDGHGVMPDEIVKPDELANITMELYAKGYFDDYANEYYKKHHSQPVDVDNFCINDEEYASFIRFIPDTSLKYESNTQIALRNLMEKAKEEQYSDTLSENFKTIESIVKTDKVSDMKKYRKEISEILENSIVLRYHYGDGVTRHKIHKDKDLNKAMEILKSGRYAEILKSQDTKRK